MNTFSPTTVVQAQLDAYNAHDVAALLAIYADDVQQFQHPDTLLAQGSAQIASHESGSALRDGHFVGANNGARRRAAAVGRVSVA